MTTTIEPRRFNDLLGIFDQLTSFHDELALVVQSKVDAMRRNDFDTMRAAGEHEQALVLRIQEREGLRRQLVDAIGVRAGWPDGAARRMTATQFGERLCETQRAVLSARVETLRESVAKLARINRVAGAVCRDIVRHMKWVFAAIRPADARSAGYTGSGSPTTGAATRLIDAVG